MIYMYIYDTLNIKRKDNKNKKKIKKEKKYMIHYIHK